MPASSALSVERSPLVPVSAIEMRAVEYLIDSFVPLGKLTDIAGQMGQGKSLLTERWAADVSTGCASLSEPASVLMFAAEDDAADTVRPRLEAAGADCERVYVLTDDSLDVSRIEDYCETVGDVRLVTVDPLTGFFPKGVDAWNTPHVRRFLRPLIELAQRRRFALVGVQHVNRSASTDPLARIADAQGIPQVARSVLLWGPDPEDPEGESGERKVLASAKTNLMRGRPAASFRIESVDVAHGINAPRLVHQGSSVSRARELLPEQARTQSPAERFLVEALADGPRLAVDMESDAARQGITKGQLRRARERVGVSSHKRRGDGAWEWAIAVHVEAL